MLLKEKFKNRKNFSPYEGPAVDPSVFYPQDMCIVRRRLGFSESKFIIGFTSSLESIVNYNYNLLVEGFAKFCCKHPDSLLLIMGDIHPRFKSDFLKIASKEGIVDKIIITGFISHQQLNLYLNACDVCVAPISKEHLLESPYYSGAIKLWEYFGCAKPVIKSDIPNSNTFHWFNDKCIIVPPDDVEAFVRALFHLHENPTLRKELGEKAYKWVLENHTWDKRAEKIEEFLWKIVR